MSKSINTGYGVQAIPNEICREIWGKPGQPEVQQEPVIYLLLAGPLGWECGVPGLPIQTSPQPSEPAYRSGTEADPGHAPPEPAARLAGAVAPPEAARLHPPA